MNTQNNIHEMKIKLACVRWLEEHCAEFAEGILINEFTSNKSKSRADLAFVSKNEIIAVEIKSNKDKITRLENQIKTLKNQYNRIEVVVSTNHFLNAKEICKKEKVGLHVIDNHKIETALKGVRRKIPLLSLENSLFPKSIKMRSDFSATEEYYRDFILKKYKNVRQEDFMEIDEKYIRNLNPHHTQRVKQALKRESYRNDLEELFHAIQSTQSSSRSAEETSRP